jgi:predicted RNase H-like HicB family nuclease
VELTAAIHHDDGSYWAEVPELPGCFDELFKSLHEGIRLYLADETGCDSQPNAAS